MEQVTDILCGYLFQCDFFKFNDGLIISTPTQLAAELTPYN